MVQTTAVSLLIHFYSWLLRLYPASFRDACREEMTAVFAQAVVEATKRGWLSVTAVILRELRDLPPNLAREHWHSLTKREVPMTSMHKKPQWSFYLGWVMLSAVSIPLAFVVYWGIIGLIVPWIGVRMQVGNQSVITEDYLMPYFFIPAIGLFTGLFQYLLLRRYWPRSGWWILATSLGWVLTAAVTVLRYPLSLRFGLDLASTSAWLPPLTYIISGSIAGLAQWLLLRRRLPHAAWWIAASVLGWGLIGITANEALKDFAVLAFGLLPAIATGAALWLLVRKLPPSAGESIHV